MKVIKVKFVFWIGFLLIFSVELAQVVFAQVDSLSWDFVMSQEWKRPERLDSFLGVHPRLLLTDKRVETLRDKITTTHKKHWEIIKEMANGYVEQSPPSDYEDQEEMRSAGRGIPWQALAYVLTRDSIYFEGAKKWMLTVCSYPRWQNNKSLAAGECLFGVSVGYDWLYNELTVDERNLIRDKLKYQAEIMKNGLPVHYDRWLANHNHVEHNGLAAAGFVLYDEVPEAITWIQQADLVFEKAFEVFSHDGSSTEGHQYWAYSVESILRYIEAARDLLGKNYYNNEWLKNATKFIIASTIPDVNAQNCVMSFGDSHRNYSSHGPTHILYKLAAEYNDGYAQWLANEMQQRNVGRGDYCTWCNLLWFDVNIQPLFLSSLPTFWQFEDIGWITTRSSWNEDGVMVAFKCGPFHGHKVQPYYEKQVAESWSEFHEIVGGHGHPDENCFQIYAYGKWLAIDPGYEKPKWTKNHNTILVKGIGQLGEGKTWFDREAVIGANAYSSVVKAENYTDYDYIIGDAGNIYPESTGLNKFYRHLLYIKPDFIIIVDELKANSPIQFEWLLHSEGNLEILSDNYCLIKNEDVLMDVHLLLPETITATNRNLVVDGLAQNVLIAHTKSNIETLIVSVLHPRRITDKQSNASVILYGDSLLELNIGCDRQKKTIKLDLTNQMVEIKM
jgi:hypothetical protein